MQDWAMPLPEWLAMRSTTVLEELGGFEHYRPWDAPEPEDPDIAAEAEAYLIAHSALRDR